MTLQDVQSIYPNHGISDAAIDLYTRYLCMQLICITYFIPLHALIINCLYWVAHIILIKCMVRSRVVDCLRAILYMNFSLYILCGYTHVPSAYYY